MIKPSKNFPCIFKVKANNNYIWADKTCYTPVWEPAYRQRFYPTLPSYYPKKRLTNLQTKKIIKIKTPIAVIATIFSLITANTFSDTAVTIVSVVETTTGSAAAEALEVLKPNNAEAVPRATITLPLVDSKNIFNLLTILDINYLPFLLNAITTKKAKNAP